MKFSTTALVSLLSTSTAFAAKNIRGLKKDDDCGCPESSGMTRAQMCQYQSNMLYANLASTPFGQQILWNAGSSISKMERLLSAGETIGSITALIPEAGDAVNMTKAIADGESGDIEFPHGHLKPVGTVGEYDICSGEMLVGVPDGMGSYLADDNTVRLVVQSESYGPLRYESVPFYVNDRTASFTGSHVQYADYERSMMAGFMNGHWPASNAVVGFGELIKYSFNLNGEMIGPRNPDGPTSVGAHFSNTDVEGNYVADGDLPKQADWFMQSLCSAHMEEKHQWGPGIGLEDDIFVTNEEWMTYAPGTTDAVGISGHVIDVANGIDYAVGAFSNSGFEKIIEVNCGHPDFVCFSLSGYNGSFGNYDGKLKRLEKYGLRDDGKNYTDTKDIVPARIYIGKKGFMEDGSAASSDDFLARNGLRYGQIYGFATDMAAVGAGSAKGLWRDAFHSDEGSNHNGAKVEGVFAPVNWKWGGVATDFVDDAAWEFQNSPVGYEDTTTEFWTAAGPDIGGKKTEHNAPDLRYGVNAFLQSSTAGYIGIYYLNGIAGILDSLSGNDLPAKFDSTYYVYQGVRSVVDQIELNGKGVYNNGYHDARFNIKDDNVYETLKSPDGLETIIAADNKQYMIIQEDSGNSAGERMFISSPLEHVEDGNELTYYLIAISGGKYNSRMVAEVGIPAGTSSGTGSHEFSGVTDLSGFFVKDEYGNFLVKKADTGAEKHAAAASIGVNEKTIVVGLQAHNMFSGVIADFQADRGGQWLAYKPNIPE